MAKRKINLEEILDRNSDLEFAKTYIPRSMIHSILRVMKEACRQTLELAAENAKCEEVEVAESIHGGDGYTYYRVNKQSIINTINQVE